MQTTKFRVTGRGEFPLDMLRYGDCHPVSEDDEANINEGQYSPIRRTVELVTEGSWIHPGRWKSFGWKVEDVPNVLDAYDVIHRTDFIR